MLTIPDCKLTSVIQVPFLVCKTKHKQSRQNGERKMFFKCYMTFQEHGCSLNLTHRHEQDGQHTEPPLGPWASSVLQSLPCPFPSLFNWLQLLLALAPANNKALKTRFSILQSELLEKVKCKATKNI